VNEQTIALKAEFSVEKKAGVVFRKKADHGDIRQVLVSIYNFLS
jgi:hypothetical protein